MDYATAIRAANEAIYAALRAARKEHRDRDAEMLLAMAGAADTLVDVLTRLEGGAA